MVSVEAEVAEVIEVYLASLDGLAGLVVGLEELSKLVLIQL